MCRNTAFCHPDCRRRVWGAFPCVFAENVLHCKHYHTPKEGFCMTKVIVRPGVCGFVTHVTAESEDQMEVKLQVASGCEAVRKMMAELGDTFDAYELCLAKPGCGPLYEYASEHFPGHAACPVIGGITKCAEAECRLALPADASITFDRE